MNDKKYLAVVDVDQIQRYIFTTDRLKEIAGASSLLDEINRVEITSIFNQCKSDSDRDKDDLLVNGAGVTKATFSDKNRAETFARSAAAAYPKRTYLATATCWVEEFTPDDFRNANQRAENRLKELKSAKGLSLDKDTFRHQPWLSSPFLQWCTVCGMFPAKQEEDWDGKDVYPCEPCLKKAEARTKDIAFLDGKGIHQEIQDKLNCFDGKKVEEVIPDDFGQLAFKSTSSNIDGSTEKSFIGLILADGNSIGEYIKNRLDSPEKMNNFSVTLEKLTRDALVGAIVSCYSEFRALSLQGLGYLPLRVLLLGGDDLLIVTAGNLALPLAAAFCKKFQELQKTPLKEKLQLQGEENLTVSAGVAIGKYKHPFFDFRHLAEGLLASAKKKGREVGSPGMPVSAIDFSAIRWSGRTSLTHFRSHLLEYNTSEGRFQQTDKPFTLEEITNIVGNIESLRKGEVPRSKLKALAKLGSRTNNLGQADEGVKNWKRQIAPSIGSLETIMPGDKFWIEDQRSNLYTTRIFDTLELIDFWPKKS